MPPRSCLQKAAVMQVLLAPAFSYFALVFAAAFVMGVLRVTILVPQIGPLMAVAVEVPVILGLSWLVAGRVLRQRFGRGQRLVIGAVAFGLLMVTEALLAIFLFHQTFADFAAALATPPGALGLAGQIGFALIPALRAR